MIMDFKLILTAVMILAAVSVACAAEPMNIGNRLELFVDGFLIDKMESAQIVMHHPTEKGVALYPDAPWEGTTSAYVTVFQDGTRFRMYYRGSKDQANTEEVTCTAESVDGIHWTKPKLGIHEYQGSNNNNIVYTGNGTHAFVPFKDTNPDVKPDEIYKAVAFGSFEGKPALFALASSDGYNWRHISDKPALIEGDLDSQNVAFFDNLRGEYVCYFRQFRDGKRDIKRATSKDFINWTKAEWLSYTGAPFRELYTNTVKPYFRASHLYLSFPMRFFPERKVWASHPHSGVSDGAFLSSRDGLSFHIWNQAFVRPGLDSKNWTDRNTMAAWGMLQTGDKELSLYYTRNYRHPSFHFARMALRLDGFASINAGEKTGTVTTKPLIFSGKELVINYSTSAGGAVRIALLDENNKPLPRFSIDECPVIYGDEIERTVKWKAGSDVSSLAGKEVRIRFELSDADVFSFRFR